MSYPIKPDFRTPSAEVRAALFGTFRYRPIGSGNIRILDGWDTQNIVKIIVPQIAGIEGANDKGQIYFHRKGVEQIQGFFEEVERQGLKHLLLSWGGSFVPRFIRGSNTSLSNHAWGTAFDINAAWNGLGRTPMAEGKTGSVIPLVKIANDFGFYWGGHYSSRLDGMHFELAALNRFPKTFVAFSSADHAPQIPASIPPAEPAPVSEPAPSAPEPVVERPPIAEPAANNTTTVQVQQAVPQSDPPNESLIDKIQKGTEWFSGKLLAIPAMVGTFVTGVWGYAVSAPTVLIVALFGSGTLIGGIYLGLYMWLKNKREARASAERVAENELKMQRERQAHEITLKQIETAASRSLNTVTVVPQPLQNSDPDPNTVGG